MRCSSTSRPAIQLFTQMFCQAVVHHVFLSQVNETLDLTISMSYLQKCIWRILRPLFGARARPFWPMIGWSDEMKLNRWPKRHAPVCTRQRPPRSPRSILLHQRNHHTQLAAHSPSLFLSPSGLPRSFLQASRPHSFKPDPVHSFPSAIYGLCLPCARHILHSHDDSSTIVCTIPSLPPSSDLRASSRD